MPSLSTMDAQSPSTATSTNLASPPPTIEEPKPETTTQPATPGPMRPKHTAETLDMALASTLGTRISTATPSGGCTPIQDTVIPPEEKKKEDEEGEEDEHSKPRFCVGTPPPCSCDGFSQTGDDLLLGSDYTNFQRPTTLTPEITDGEYHKVLNGAHSEEDEILQTLKEKHRSELMELVERQKRELELALAARRAAKLSGGVLTAPASTSPASPPEMHVDVVNIVPTAALRASPRRRLDKHMDILWQLVGHGGDHHSPHRARSMAAPVPLAVASRKSPGIGMSVSASSSSLVSQSSVSTKTSIPTHAGKSSSHPPTAQKTPPAVPTKPSGIGTTPSATLPKPKASAAVRPNNTHQKLTPALSSEAKERNARDTFSQPPSSGVKRK